MNLNSLPRRRFLRTTAGLALSAPLVAREIVRTTHGAELPCNRVTLGFIGVGWKGFEGCWGSLLQSFIREPGVQVLAVCDVDPRFRERAKACVDEFPGDAEANRLLARAAREPWPV